MPHEPAPSLTAARLRRRCCPLVRAPPRRNRHRHRGPHRRVSAAPLQCPMLSAPTWPRTSLPRAATPSMPPWPAPSSLAVTYPEAGNLGGGGFMLIYVDGAAQFLDYRETAPAAATRDMYLDARGDVIDGLSLTGHRAVGVPGTVAGLWEAHQRHGKLPWRDVIEPAVQLAERGFQVPPLLAERATAEAPRFASTNFAQYFGGLAQRRVVSAAGTRRDVAAHPGRRTRRLLPGRDRGPDRPGDAAWRRVDHGTGPARLSRRVARTAAQHLARPDPAVVAAAEFRRLCAAAVPGNEGCASHRLRGRGAQFAAVRAPRGGDRQARVCRSRRICRRPRFRRRADRPTGGSRVHPRARGRREPQRDLARAEHRARARRTAPHDALFDRRSLGQRRRQHLHAEFGFRQRRGRCAAPASCSTTRWTTSAPRPACRTCTALLGGDANAIEPGKRMLSSMSPTILLDRDGTRRDGRGLDGWLDDHHRCLAGAGRRRRLSHDGTTGRVRSRVFTTRACRTISSPTTANSRPPRSAALRQRGYRVEPHEWPLGDVQLIVRTPAGWDAASDPRGRGEVRRLP